MKEPKFMQNLPSYKISNNKDLALLFGVPTATLTYYAYHLSDERKYKSFKIIKRSGGERLIEAPIKGLKDLQKTLSNFLSENFKPRACVYAYVKDRGIVEHAATHIGQRWVLRIDLKDFFHSITSTRITGLLRKSPYNFAKSPAETVARLCTIDGRMPQGSPVSPIFSNIICRGLDYKLKELSSLNKCYYTRYADDIFISNNGSLFPSAIASRNDDGSVQLSDAIKDIITKAGFVINIEKVILRKRSERQLVTGVVVNKKSNVPKVFVKSIRSSLYAWEKFGLPAAEDYWKREIYKNNTHNGEIPSFNLVIRGKITHVGHVKGYADPTYLSLAKRLQALDSEFHIDEEKIFNTITSEIHIYTEGVTDTKHFQAALNFFKSKGDFQALNLVFKNPRKTGSANLKALCENLSETQQKHLLICIFDRDEPAIIKEMSGSPVNYRDHNNNVFSLIISIPDFRRDLDYICIEHLYKDSDLYIADSEGRRLYSKDEFDNLGCHKHLDNLFCRSSKSSLIYDNMVIDLPTKTNVALPKNKFAEYIINAKAPFNDIDFEGFRPTFNQIFEIASTYRK